MPTKKTKKADAEEVMVVAYKGFDREARFYRNVSIANGYEWWEPVGGFEGLYEVSSEGRVRSLPRKTRTGVLGGRILHPAADANGYVRVTLSRDGKASRFLLHRLVLLAFAGEPGDGEEARHLDGNPSNNAWRNLQWGSRSENSYDRVRHGTQHNNKGQRHPLSTLTDAQAGEIRARRNAGETLKAVANDFAVSIQTVCRIAKGRGWNHV